MKQQPSFERVIGGTEEQKKEVLRHTETYTKQTEEEIYGEYLVEPTKEENEMISLATEYANRVSKHYGAKKEFPTERIYLLAPGSVKKITNQRVSGGCCDRLDNTVAIERKNHLNLATTTVHEIFHMNSHLSGQIQISEKTSALLNKPYREGISMHGRNDEKIYFKDAEEAIIATLSKRFFDETFANDPKYVEEIKRTEEIKKWLLKYIDKNITDESDKYNYTSAINDILFLPNNERVYKMLYESTEQDDYKYGYFEGAYEEELKSGEVFLGRSREREKLNAVIERILKKSNDTALTKDTLLDLFARAHFTGNYLPLAKTIEKALGKGAFRNIAEELGSKVD